MCTVTFIPAKDVFYLTSNRDEKSLRKQAVPTKKYEHYGYVLIYPQDGYAGGSWIAMRNDGTTGVLLNGAFHKHESRPPYRKSRGKIFLDVIASVLPADKFLSIDLLNIEPFTLIIFHQENLWEARWNGDKKFLRHLENDKPWIWSSATLYTTDVIKRRERWFFKWLEQNPTHTQQTVLDFHRFAGDGDVRNDLFMNWDGHTHTVSTTSIQLSDTKVKMSYFDFIDNNRYSAEVNLIASELR